MLEPSMREYPVQAAKDIYEILNADILAVRIGDNHESAGEQLLVRHHIRRPVESVAAVVDGAAALGLLMDCTQKLPFGGTHFGTRAGAARRRVEQEANHQ